MTESTLFLQVVEHEEYREIEPEYDGEGNTVSLRPIPGSDTAFLQLKAPNGTLVRAQIPHEQLDGILAMMYPGLFDQP